MIKNRIPAVIVAGLVLTGALTACVPIKDPGSSGPHRKPVPAGTRHQFDAVATLMVGGKPVSSSMPLQMWADVVIVDGEHGISIRSARPYPDSWEASAAHQRSMRVTYWSGSNPTTFTFRATLAASAVAHMGDSAAIELACQFFRDGHAVTPDDRSHPWAAITPAHARTGAVKTIGILCIYTDHHQ